MVVMTPRIVVFIVISLVIGTILGYAIGARANDKIMSTNPATVQTDNHPLLTNRSASANGKITKFENNEITLTNETSGSANFKLVENALIFKLNNGAISSPSSDLKNIILDQQVGVNLTYVEGEYRVASITYTPIVAPIPVRTNPAASGSATTSKN